MMDEAGQLVGVLAEDDVAAHRLVGDIHAAFM
jgi:hypothetical protein